MKNRLESPVLGTLYSRSDNYLDSACSLVNFWCRGWNGDHLDLSGGCGSLQGYHNLRFHSCSTMSGQGFHLPYNHPASYGESRENYSWLYAWLNYLTPRPALMYEPLPDVNIETMADSTGL